MGLTTSQLDAFDKTASILRIADAQWLVDMVGFESGFNPKAKNPFSSARGIIQFIDSTAQNLGYANSLDLVNQNPTLEAQLADPVIEYLRPYSPFNSEADLYMAVFLPIARGYDENTTFEKVYKDKYGANYRDRYERFKKGNPRILRIVDYINHVKKKPIIRIALKLGAGSVVVAMSYLIYLKLRQGKYLR